uniref:glutathione transferase n=1 Tax=Oryza brachyantha TaxID=4533 RepID=J3N4B0_ORYBR
MAGRNEQKLLGNWASAYVTRVKLALHLKGVTYDYVEEDLRNKSDLLLESNPVHKTVPVLIHNGRPICESQIIVQYIDEVFSGDGESLLPADPHERAVARFWAAYIEDKLVAPWEKVFRAKTEEERAVWMKQMFVAADALEGGLKECSKGKGCFFGGDSVGYVDVVLGGAVSFVHANDVITGAKLFDAARTPLLAAWLERFGELDAAKAVLQDVERAVEHTKMVQARNAVTGATQLRPLMLSSGGDSVGYVDVVLGGAVSFVHANDVITGAKLFDAARTPLLAVWLERFGELDAAKAVLQDVERAVEHTKMVQARNAVTGASSH